MCTNSIYIWWGFSWGCKGHYISFGSNLFTFFNISSFSLEHFHHWHHYVYFSLPFGSYYHLPFGFYFHWPWTSNKYSSCCLCSHGHTFYHSVIVLCLWTLLSIYSTWGHTKLFLISCIKHCFNMASSKMLYSVVSPVSWYIHCVS